MKNLIELMGGEISVTSEPQVGSVFTVTLPFDCLTQEEQKQLEEQTLSVSPSSSELVSLPSPGAFSVPLKILIVDDNAINRKVILRQLSGYDCQLAINGQEALEKYDNSQFDIILMDIMMPIMDGITATKHIRQREQDQQLPRTPIIAISANALERDRADILESGIEDFIIKPFKKVDIIAKIEQFRLPNRPAPRKEDAWSIPVDSPLHHLHQLQKTLDQITVGKKWSVNLDTQIWLELEDEEEGEPILRHFKVHGYHAIESQYQLKSDQKVPILFLKEIDFLKLKALPTFQRTDALLTPPQSPAQLLRTQGLFPAPKLPSPGQFKPKRASLASSTESVHPPDKHQQ